jgi:hypothetical protein
MQDKSYWYETSSTCSLANIGQRSNGFQPVAMRLTLDASHTKVAICPTKARLVGCPYEHPNELINLDITVSFMYHNLIYRTCSSPTSINININLSPSSQVCYKAPTPNQNPAQESVHQDCNNDQLPIPTSKVPDRASIHVENHDSSHENRRL